MQTVQADEIIKQRKKLAAQRQRRKHSWLSQSLTGGDLWFFK